MATHNTANSHTFPSQVTLASLPLGDRDYIFLLLNLWPATVVERIVCDPNCAGEMSFFLYLLTKNMSTWHFNKCVGPSYQEFLWYQLGTLHSVPPGHCLPGISIRLHRCKNLSPTRFSCFQAPHTPTLQAPSQVPVCHLYLTYWL